MSLKTELINKLFQHITVVDLEYPAYKNYSKPMVVDGYIIPPYTCQNLRAIHIEHVVDIMKRHVEKRDYVKAYGIHDVYVVENVPIRTNETNISGYRDELIIRFAKFHEDNWSNRLKYENNN